MANLCQSAFRVFYILKVMSKYSQLVPSSHAVSGPLIGVGPRPQLGVQRPVDSMTRFLWQKTTTPMHRIAVPRNEAQKTKGMEPQISIVGKQHIYSCIRSSFCWRNPFGFTVHVLDFAESWAHPELATRCSWHCGGCNSEINIGVDFDWLDDYATGPKKLAWRANNSELKISNAVPEQGPDGIDSPVDSSKVFLHWKCLKSCDDPIMINIARSSMTPESLPTARFFVSHCTRRPKTSLQGWWMASAQWNSNGSIENKSESGISMKPWFVFCVKSKSTQERE